MSFQNNLGNLVSNIGTSLGLPEMTLSERISSFGSNPNAPILRNSVSPEQMKTYQQTAYSVPGGVQPISNKQQPQQQPQQQQQQPSGVNLKDKNSNPGADWWWDAADGWKQSGGQSEQDLSQMISDLYDPALRLADQQQGTVQSGYSSDVENLNNRYNQTAADYNSQGEQLISETDKQQSDFNKVIESALSQAVRAYNALQQRGQVMYGGASSTGRAMGELAQREFARQQGNIQNKQVEGAESFGIEKTKIKQYVDSKKKDLDNWKNEALTALQNNLKAQLDTIAARRYDIEANRTRDKMSLLQNTINQTKAVQEQDKAFRQNLAVASLNQLQQISGRTFTPAEIKAYISEFTSDFGFSGDTNNSGSAISQVSKKPKTYKDELDSLNAVKSENNTTPTLNTNSYIASDLPTTDIYNTFSA